MATPQWEAIKAYVAELNAADMPAAMTALGATYNAKRGLSGNKSDLSRAAYNYSKARSAETGNYVAAYELTLSKLKSAVSDAAGKPDGASVPDAADAEDAPDVSPENTADALKASDNGPAGLDREATLSLLEKLARNYDKRMKAAGAITKEEVRELCKEVFAELPPLRIEVTRDGATIGEVKGAQHKQFATLLKAATTRLANGYHPNVWLAGPAGSGKTHAADTLAKALGRDFFYNGALSMSHEVLGFKDAGGTFHETPFYQGYTRPSVYLFDECDGCADNSPLLAVNGALSNGLAAFANGMQKRHPDSLIIAAANTWGLGATADYVGRAKIDGAFLDRFAIKIFWDYDADLEVTLYGKRAAYAVQEARERAKKNGLRVLITPRATAALAALTEAGFSMEEAKTLTYRANLTAEQAKLVG